MTDGRPLRSVGRPVVRRDAREKATGRWRFLSDLDFRGALWAGVIRSPHAHAAVARIDRDLLAGQSDTVAVFTADEVPQTRFNPALAPAGPELASAADKRLLTNVARHVADGVAVVVARTREGARRAARLPAVDWSVLKPVVDLESALEQDQVIGDVTLERPAVDRVIASSAVIVDQRFRISAAQHVCLETHCCAAVPDGRGGIHLWSNTQAPNELRRLVAHVLGLDVDRLRVSKVDEGGGFGCRQEMYEEALVSWLALRLGRPVRITYDREEELAATRCRHGAMVDVRMGLDRDGVLLAASVEAALDSGAYASHAPYVIASMGATASITYPHALSRFVGRIVRTNTVPGGAYRGYGNGQVNFAIEQAMDVAAGRLGVDPVELRSRNWARAAAAGLDRSGERERCLRLGQAAFGWPRRHPDRGDGLRRASGVAVASKATASLASPEASTATVRRSPDGTATLLTGTCDCGTGSSTALAQLVAEELDVPVDAVRVQEGDTGDGHPDTASSAQRSVLLGGSAAVQAARIARARSSGTATFRTGADSVSHCACFVTVAVDPSTGVVRVEECLIAVGCGRVINPLGATGQIAGGSVQGLGLALIDAWTPATSGAGPSSVQEHGVPCPRDVPRIGVVSTDVPFDSGPYGAGGLGELPLLPVGAAIGNAVARALGVRCMCQPLRPVSVWQALEGRG